MATKEERGVLANRLDALGAPGAAGLARGASKLIDAPSVAIPIGASGGSGTANRSTKQQAVTTQLDKRGSNRANRSGGVAGSGTGGNRANLINTGRTEVGTGVFGGIERAALNKVKSRRGVGPTGNLKAVDTSKPKVASASGTVRNKDVINPVVRGQLDVLNPPTKSLIGGGRKPPLHKGQGTLREVSGEVEARKKRGEKRTGRGGFTDTGTFRRTNDGKTLREEANAPGLFKSTRDIIAGNIKANKASAQAKGARADAKAINAQRKSLGDLFESISATEPDSPLLDTIKAKLLALDSPIRTEEDEAGDLLAIDPNMDRGTLRQILALKRGS